MNGWRMMKKDRLIFTFSPPKSMTFNLISLWLLEKKSLLDQPCRLETHKYVGICFNVWGYVGMCQPPKSWEAAGCQRQKQHVLATMVSNAVCSMMGYTDIPPNGKRTWWFTIGLWCTILSDKPNNPHTTFEVRKTRPSSQVWFKMSVKSWRHQSDPQYCCCFCSCYYSTILTST